MDATHHSLSFDTMQHVVSAMCQTGRNLVRYEDRMVVPMHIDRGYLLPEEVGDAYAAVNAAGPVLIEQGTTDPEHLQAALLELHTLTSSAPTADLDEVLGR